MNKCPDYWNATKVDTAYAFIRGLHKLSFLCLDGQAIAEFLIFMTIPPRKCCQSSQQYPVQDHLQLRTLLIFKLHVQFLFIYESNWLQNTDCCFKLYVTATVSVG